MKKQRDSLLRFAQQNLNQCYPNQLFPLLQAENANSSDPYSDDELYAIVREAIVAGPIRPPLICASASAINLDDVQEPTFYIPQLLAEGVTFLNSPPKGGKSRLFMQMALALCNGDTFMGRRCKRSGVLYLALEDEHADFENRLRLFLQGEVAPSNLYFATLEDFEYEPPTLERDELIEVVEKNLIKHPEIKIVLIDVFGVIRSKRQRGEEFMDTERRDIQTLIKLAARNAIAVVVAHHVSHSKRRGQLETVGSGAGSYVVAATVHAEMLLYKSKDSNHHVFSVQGRRMPLQSFAVQDVFPRWIYCGNDKEYVAANDPLTITIKHIVNNAEGDKWRGSSTDIVKYARNHDLPAIAEKPNRNTFTPKLIKQLELLGIRYQRINNGSGAVKHEFQRI